MTRSSRRRATLATALLTAVLLPAGALPALAATEPVAAPLPAPANLSPDDSSAGFPRAALKTVRLDWSPVPGATGYRVEVGRDSTWSDGPVMTKDVVSSEITLPVSLPHATYVWRVAALKGATLGHWSSEEGLTHADAELTRGWRTAPTPISPIGDQAPGLQEFSWSPVPFASAYEVQVSSGDFGSGSAAESTDAAATSPAPDPQTQQEGTDVCFTTRTRVTFFTEHVKSPKQVSPGVCISKLLGTGETRYWRVRALDQYTGAAVQGATSPGATQISYLPPSDSTEPNIGDPCPNIDDCEPVAPSEKGSWSAVQAFSMTVDAPGEGTVTAPALTQSLQTDPDSLCVLANDDADVAEHATCTDFPTLRWDKVAGATRYRVTVALDDAYSNVQRIIDTAGLSWTPTDAWPDSSPGTAYFYTVQACTPTGCGPADQNPRFFRKLSPRLALGAGPAPTSPETPLTWQSYSEALAAKSGKAASQDAVAYRVQVAKASHPSYDVVVEDVTVDQTRHLSSTKTYPDGDYVWRVQAIDGAGHKLPWSYSKKFTKDTTVPSLVSVTPASKVGVKTPLKLTFSEPVTGVSASSITLSPAAPFTVAVTGTKTATLTPSTPFLPGSTHVVRPTTTIKDAYGQAASTAGKTFTVNPFADDVSPAIRYSSGWRVMSSTDALGGRFRVGTPTSSLKPSASMAFRGTGVALHACLGPSNGIVDVYVDGVRKATKSLYRSFSGCGVKLVALSGLTAGAHTVKVVATGTKASASRGTSISLDSFTVTP